MSGEQSTTTTTIATSAPIIWIKEPLEPDFAEPPEDIDDDTVQYFNDLFKKQGISLEDDREADPHLQAHCGGNTSGIPIFCLDSIYHAFCQEVQEDPSKTLSKTFTGLDEGLGPIGLIGGPIGPIDLKPGHHSGMHKRRLLAKSGICSDWSFELHWSGAHSECSKTCIDYLAIIREQCLRFRTNDEGSLDTGCGTYSLEIKSVPGVSTIQSTSSEQTGTPSASTEATKATTESPSPEPTGDPKMPLELKPVVCEDEANFPGHADIRKDDQRLAAGVFCETYFSRDHLRWMDSHDEAVTGIINVKGTSYSFSVSWIDGCETTVASQAPMYPFNGNDLSCENIFVKAFKDCEFVFVRKEMSPANLFYLGINDGVGGYIDAGCLRYSFIGK